MTVHIELDRIGNVTLTPTNKAQRNELKCYLAQWGIRSNGSVLLVQNYVETLKSLGLSDEQIGDLQDGWSVTVNVDGWTFLHLYGWDAHTLAETGRIKYVA